MRDYLEEEGAAPVRFFHISTDGTQNGIVHFDDSDYQQAIKISAINAEKHNVGILSYCHMSTHSHFVVWAESKENAKAYAEAYKRDYARYLALKRGIRKPFSDITCEPKEITDLFYLRNCIAYTLLNPVVPGIVRYPEEYRWSSVSAYFNPSEVAGIRVSSLGTVRQREIMKTKYDFSKSKLLIDNEENIVIRSLVDYKTVERIFGSQSAFFKALALTNSVEEEEKYVQHTLKYDDTELMAEFISLAQKRFKKVELKLLTKSEKLSLILPVQRKTGVTPKRIARILRLAPEEVTALLAGRSLH